MSITQFRKQRRTPSGQAGRMKKGIVNKLARLMGIQTPFHASAEILFLASREGRNNMRTHCFAQRSNTISCSLITTTFQFVGFGPNSLIGIDCWTELISVLLRVKINDQSTAYTCIKITILSECIGVYDDIILYQSGMGKQNGKFLL